MLPTNFNLALCPSRTAQNAYGILSKNLLSETSTGVSQHLMATTSSPSATSFCDRTQEPLSRGTGFRRFNAFKNFILSKLTNNHQLINGDETGLGRELYADKPFSFFAKTFF